MTRYLLRLVIVDSRVQRGTGYTSQLTEACNATFLNYISALLKPTALSNDAVFERIKCDTIIFLLDTLCEAASRRNGMYKIFAVILCLPDNHFQS